MTSQGPLFIIVAAGSAILLLTAVTLKHSPSDAAPSSEHAAAIPPMARQGEATTGNASVVSPPIHSREV